MPFFVINIPSKITVTHELKLAPELSAQIDRLLTILERDGGLSQEDEDLLNALLARTSAVTRRLDALDAQV